MTNNKFDKSEFAADTEDKKEYPYCQILNDKRDFGLFVPLAEAHKASFVRSYLNVDNVIKHQSSVGNELEGVLFKAPKMSVLHETPLLMRVRTDESDSNGKLYKFDKDYYSANKHIKYRQQGRKEQAKVSTLQRWLIYLYDQNNDLLHEHPLLLTLKARMSVELGKNGFQQLKNQFNRFFWEGQSKTGTGRFNALIMFEPRFTTKLVGEVDKSLACCLEGYQEITKENHEDYFIGFHDDTKQYLYEQFAKYSDFVEFPEIDSTNFAASSSQVAKPEAQRINSFARRTETEDVNEQLELAEEMPF